MKNVFLKAYAKINIGLNILAKRPDGYHEIETLFQQIDLFDTITLKSLPGTEIVIKSSDKSVPLNRQNTCYKAADMLRKFAGIAEGIEIAIDKKIPIGAGLGGGSSDAASVLKGLTSLWKIRIGADNLREIARKVGADVPFFLTGGSALATGIGDKLAPVKIPSAFFIVLVYPNIEISTQYVYKNFTFDLTKTKKIIKLTQILQSNIDLFELRKFVSNDLEEVAFREYPELLTIKNKLYQYGAFFASMSGSGSTIYGLFKNYDAAVEVDKIFSKSYQTFLTQPINKNN